MNATAAPSSSTTRETPLPASAALAAPLAHFQLNQMLALMQWSATMWMFGNNQLSRYSTFLRGGVPLDA